jgi:N-acetylmuramoyl-L-alanine amidase
LIISEKRSARFTATDNWHFVFSMHNQKIYIAFILLICIAGGIFGSGICEAITPKQAYFNAEACYKKLRNAPAKMKYRDNWLRCIEKFQTVYRSDSAGPWAPAGLFMSGKLYTELSKRSWKASDHQEALDIFERIIKRYPRSKYRAKAAAEIRALSQSSLAKKKAPPAKAPPKLPPSATDRYLEAESCYSNLKQSTGKMAYRDNWLQCIEKFYGGYRDDPDGDRAAASLFMTGKLYADLYQRSKRKSDLRAAHTMYEKVVASFPDSRFGVKAGLLIDAMPKWVKKDSTSERQDLAKTSNEGAQNQTDDPEAVVGTTSAVSGKWSVVDDLRFWSNPNYTRVVINASRETEYYSHLLKKDPSINKPQRLYVDLKNSRLGRNIKKSIPIDDDLLSDARAGQYTHDSVRVVVDIKSIQRHKIFSLKDPFRIVIDVWGTDKTAKTTPHEPSVTIKKNGKLPAGALAKQLALGVRRIVIDPGHGGRDYGAPGYLKGVHEKHVTLQIARRLAKLIRKELKCEVVLTRNSDRFLTLEERTAIANTKNADLFISIHTNSHKDRRAYGIETYFLNLATDDDAIRVAAMENATSTKNISDLQTILHDLMQNAKINESSRLAGNVQVSVVNHLKRKRWRRIKDKGVKQAPFYVLLGAQMPAILVETGFISNPRECKRLVDSQYQKRLCEAIVIGIKKYIQEITPTAHRYNHSEMHDDG